MYTQSVIDETEEMPLANSTNLVMSHNYYIRCGKMPLLNLFQETWVIATVIMSGVEKMPRIKIRSSYF
jgi:hypothetical protein